MWKWLKALNLFESDNYAPWMREEIAALRDQLDAAEIELADKAFYVREFAAVSQERDGARAELAALKSQPGWELDVTVGEIEHIAWEGRIGEMAQAILDLCRSRIRPAATYGGWHFENGGIVPNGMPEGVPVRSVRFDVTPEEFNQYFSEQDRGLFDPEVIPLICDYLAERAVVLVPQPATPSTYTDADVEKLARVLRAAYMKECRIEPSDCPPNRGYVAEARAALDWMGAPMGKCKECEKLRKRGDKWADDCVKLAGAIKNARAALEGE